MEFKTNINHNDPTKFLLSVKNGDIELIGGDCEVKQLVANLLQFHKGEDCIFSNLGIDYKRFLELYNSKEYHLAKAYIIEAIYKVRGVISVNSMDIVEDSINHTLKINYNITTKYGVIAND